MILNNSSSLVKKWYYADELADFISNLQYKKLTTDVVEKAKLCVLDSIGVAIAGSKSTETDIVLNVLKNQGYKQEATVWMRNFKLSSIQAAFVNGTMAHSLDYDDTNMDGSIHAGASVIPASLVIGEQLQMSGIKVLEAIIAGYEVAIRVATAINYLPYKAHHGRGFHPTATCGIFGAVAAAAKLKSLNVNQIANALGIAGSFSAGLNEYLQNGSMTKRMHAGKAAAEGILCVDLAEKGFTGPHSVFEGKNGFFKAYSAKVNESFLVEKLRDEFSILRVSHKYYACCHCSHTALDALQSLVLKHNLNVKEISKIEIKLPEGLYSVIGTPIEQKHNPKTPLDAQMSLPYCAAVLLLDGMVSVEQFSKKRIKDLVVQNITKRIIPILDKRLDKDFRGEIWPAEVNIETTDGRTFFAREENPKGSSLKPLSSKDVELKIANLVKPYMSQDTTTKLINVISELDKMENIHILYELLR